MARNSVLQQPGAHLFTTASRFHYRIGPVVLHAVQLRAEHTGLHPSSDGRHNGRELRFGDPSCEVLAPGSLPHSPCVRNRQKYPKRHDGRMATCVAMAAEYFSKLLKYFRVCRRAGPPVIALNDQNGKAQQRLAPEAPERATLQAPEDKHYPSEPQANNKWKKAGHWDEVIEAERAACVQKSK